MVRVEEAEVVYDLACAELLLLQELREASLIEGHAANTQSVVAPDRKRRNSNSLDRLRVARVFGASGVQR
eukprot:8019166-Prorocentrum_lima.AAC.1